MMTRYEPNNDEVISEWEHEERRVQDAHEQRAEVADVEQKVKKRAEEFHSYRELCRIVNSLTTR